MTAFIVSAIILLLVVVAILVRPIWRSHPAASVGGAGEANLAILRDQLAELERERQEGTLDAQSFAESYKELQRRLLDEVDVTGRVTVSPGASTSDLSGASPSSSRRTVFALLLLLPLLALLGYALLGNPRALDPLQRQARLSPSQIETMVAGLEDKLRQNPDDSQGWLMLARSYKVLEKFPEAVKAYDQVSELVNQDPNLLADYAETISQAQGGSLQGKPGELIDRALKLDPNAPQALLLAGAAARERRQFAVAADHWSRLLAQLEPGSAEAETLSAVVAQVRQLAAQASAGRSMPLAGPRTIGGEVSLSGKLAGQARPSDILYVFARAEDGQRMPLAALRASVGDLPLRFLLDDSMALPGGRKLSEFRAVQVEARIAKSGTAKSSSGDLFGRLAGVKLGSNQLRLVIDQVEP